MAIIGGGISGLAAALELTKGKYDCQLTLFESRPRLGGVLETDREGAYLIERSADNFATLQPAALELTREFASVDGLLQPEAENRLAQVLHRERIEPVPAGFSLMQPTKLSSILGTGALSPTGKLRLLYEYFVPRRTEELDESLESFATRRLGKEAFTNLIEPIVAGIFTADPAKLSMRAALPQFVEMERKHGGLIRASLAAKKSNAADLAKKASGARYEQFRAPRFGMSDWVSQLGQKLPNESLRLNCEVDSVTKSADGYQIKYQSVACKLGNALQTSELFDSIVLATPASATARLLRPLQPAASEEIAGIHYASSVIVAMVVPRDEILGNVNAFGLIVPSKEGREVLAISYSSNKYAGRVPRNELLLRMFFGGAMNPEFCELDDEAVLRAARQELTEVLRWRGKAPKTENVIRWPNAMPQYELGHVEKVQRVRHLMKTGCPQIELCGAAYTGVGIPQCVQSGRQAARNLFAES
ncbi:MAG: protoporphyrinogen oxidase [Planctomycetota bacterium]|nr:protoporphyrinogen oxidase [Planctomycetota bacterium]